MSGPVTGLPADDVVERVLTRLCADWDGYLEPDKQTWRREATAALEHAGLLSLAETVASMEANCVPRTDWQFQMRQAEAYKQALAAEQARSKGLEAALRVLHGELLGDDEFTVGATDRQFAARQSIRPKLRSLLASLPVEGEER